MSDIADIKFAVNAHLCRFNIGTFQGIEPGSLMTGIKWVDHWTSGTVQNMYFSSQDSSAVFL
jgi:hypothetical protein